MYCPRCGKKQDENVEYCSDCGISLKKGYSKSDEKEIRIDIVKKFLRAIICFGYGFCFNIIGLILYRLVRNDEEDLAKFILLGSLTSVTLLVFLVVSKILM